MSGRIRKITADEMMYHDPCSCYPLERVKALFGDGLTLLQICDLPIPAADRLWALHREGILPDRINRLFACWGARESIGKAGGLDPCLLEGVGVAERFAIGEATEDELYEAKAKARRALRAANWSAAQAAGWAATAVAKAVAVGWSSAAMSTLVAAATRRARHDAANVAWMDDLGEANGLVCQADIVAATNSEEERQLAKLREMIISEACDPALGGR